MKIAIFHNFMDNIGGAELVDLILARELKADIYTTNIDHEKIRKMGFSTDNIFSIGRIPINAPFRQEVAYWKFKKLNLGKKYDFYIIAGDWAMSAGKNHKPNLWYVYSPKREIWDLFSFTRNHTVKWYEKPIFDVWAWYHRYLDRRDLKEIDRIVSTSGNVQQRVKRYFGKDTNVIYPPIEASKFYCGKNGGYWLSVNRLITHKRVDMQIKAFEKLPNEKLVVVGSYEKSRHFQKYANYINGIKPSNVEIRSWVSDEELKELYANCRGFITTSRDEDFGLTVLEAMASGKPVIAPNEGGYKETIINGETGKLVEDITVDKLIEAVEEIGRNSGKYEKACLNQAKKFDVKIFIKKMIDEIK